MPDRQLLRSWAATFDLVIKWRFLFYQNEMISEMQQ